MTPKRGEGAVKPLSEEIEEFIDDNRRTWKEFPKTEYALGMVNSSMLAYLERVKALERRIDELEASAPSTLIAAVEAIQNELAADYNGKAPILQRPRREILSQTIEELNGVLNLLRIPPTEEVA